MSANEITIPIGELSLDATLTVPPDALGLVVFAHGSGSTRWSARNQYIAAALASRRIATLLVDLETADEVALEALEATLRDDSHILAERLIAVLDSVLVNELDDDLPIGLFGSDVAAAASLIAAARRPDVVTAVVSCSGRLDLAASSLEQVRAATLFITASSDLWGQRTNRAMAGKLLGINHLVVVPGAGPAFSEPGALDEVAALAGRWFEENFRRGMPVKRTAAR